MKSILLVTLVMTVSCCTPKGEYPKSVNPLGLRTAIFLAHPGPECELSVSPKCAGACGVTRDDKKVTITCN